MEEVKLLTDVDVLRALYNSYLEKKLVSQLNIRYYTYKQDNLRNGDNIKTVKQNLINSEHNLEDTQRYLEYIQEEIEKLKMP